jgi:hypothetical protein
MFVDQNFNEAQQPKKKAIKQFKNISNTAPAIAPPVPRRNSMADEIKQHVRLAIQASHKSSICSLPETLWPTPPTSAIKMTAGVNPRNKAMAGVPLGFCGSFELFSMELFWFPFAIRKTRVVAAEGIQFAIRADNVGAAAVNAVFVPRCSVHERLDEEPERVRFIQLELLEQFAERFRFTAALHQVFEFIADFGAEKSLDVFEIDEIADGTDLPAHFEQIADGRAIGITARQRREILEAQFARRLSNGGENDVRSIQTGSRLILTIWQMWNPSTGEHRLEGNSAHVRPAKTKVNCLP